MGCCINTVHLHFSIFKCIMTISKRYVDEYIYVNFVASISLIRPIWKGGQIFALSLFSLSFCLRESIKLCMLQWSTLHPAYLCDFPEMDFRPQRASGLNLGAFLVWSVILAYIGTVLSLFDFLWKISVWSSGLLKPTLDFAFSWYLLLCLASNLLILNPFFVLGYPRHIQIKNILFISLPFSYVLYTLRASTSSCGLVRMRRSTLKLNF